MNKEWDEWQREHSLGMYGPEQVMQLANIGCSLLWRMSNMEETGEDLCDITSDLYDLGELCRLLVPNPAREEGGVLDPYVRQHFMPPLEED